MPRSIPPSPAERRRSSSRARPASASPGSSRSFARPLVPPAHCGRAASASRLGEGGLPYVPVAALIRDLTRQLDDADAARRARPRRRRTSAAIVPGLADRLPGVTPASDAEWIRPAVFEAVVSCLESLGSRQPVVLVLEDLHWADPASLDLIAFLVRSRRRAGTLVVATYRSDELHRRHPLLPMARRDRPPRRRRADRPPATRRGPRPPPRSQRSSGTAAGRRARRPCRAPVGGQPVLRRGAAGRRGRPGRRRLARTPRRAPGPARGARRPIPTPRGRDLRRGPACRPGSAGGRAGHTAPRLSRPTPARPSSATS